MPQYIVFINRKKSHEETLREYYNATILGVIESSNAGRAIRDGAIHFRIGQGHIDVKAFSRAIDYEKKAALKKMEGK